uniref:Uncharacterized protein n=1 Tax=Anguilla anguilla TaxID=7936 RepID=A0A0E9UR24_ANGAN
MCCGLLTRISVAQRRGVFWRDRKC